MKRTLAFGLATAATVALASWIAGMREVRAPEPVILTQPLGNAIGGSAQGYYVSTGDPTYVFRFPITFVTCSGPVATGKPCSTAAAAADTIINGTMVLTPPSASR